MLELRRELGDKFEVLIVLRSHLGRIFLSLIKDVVLGVWEERKVRLYGEHSNVHQSHSRNASGVRDVTVFVYVIHV